MLHEMLQKVAAEYVYARGHPFAKNPLGEFVRKELATEARKRLLFLPYDLKVKGSVGAGVWAAVPWLGFFDPIVTTTATRGFYVVYLINPQTEEIFLSLNQGTTAVYREYGESNGREVLARRSQDLLQRAGQYGKVFDTDPITLGSDASLPKGYEAGHAFGRRYQKGTVNEGGFYSDLEQMLSAYELLVDLGGTTPADLIEEEAGTNDVIEAKKYYLARRIERAPNVRKRVLISRGAKCEGCGLEPKSHLAFKGPIESTPLDVHHSKPISHLSEGESRRYRIPDDFRVLCPTCHRLIHRQGDPSDIEQLRNRINFEIQEIDRNSDTRGGG